MIINHVTDTEYERVSYLCQECGEPCTMRYDLGDAIDETLSCSDCDTRRHFKDQLAIHNASHFQFHFGCYACRYR